jgi:hypothetical protein
MMKSVEVSLRRLNTDHIDLYYLHMWDYMTPVDEVLRGMEDLVRSEGQTPAFRYPIGLWPKLNTCQPARLVPYRLPGSLFTARPGR